MKCEKLLGIAIVSSCLMLSGVACKQESAPKSARPAKSSTATTPAKTLPKDPTPMPASPTVPATATAQNSLNLEGITLSIPNGWKNEPVSSSSPMAPKAVLEIPNGDGEPGSIRITHFPRMKGMDQQNIQRWLMQAKKPDGSPMTSHDAQISTEEHNGVKITIVDLAGTIKATMRDSAKPDQRMIAAIVDHAKGPHFIVAVGPQDLIGKKASTIRDFLRSATVAP